MPILILELNNFRKVFWETQETAGTTLLDIEDLKVYNLANLSILFLLTIQYFEKDW